MSEDPRDRARDEEPTMDEAAREPYDPPAVEDIPVDRPAVTMPGVVVVVDGSPDVDN
jgi:hypothetical protein